MYILICLHNIRVDWIVPENIHTPTTGGIEILPPPCIRKFQNAPPPPPMHSEFQTPLPPLSFGIPEVFWTPSEFPIQSSNPPRNLFSAS